MTISTKSRNNCPPPEYLLFVKACMTSGIGDGQGGCLCPAKSSFLKMIKDTCLVRCMFRDVNNLMKYIFHDDEKYEINVSMGMKNVS